VSSEPSTWSRPTPPRVACLAGAGTAPELIAEASLALTAVARLHGFSVDEVHVPCGAAAVARAGQSFPAAARSAVLDADAVLLAGAEDPTLAEVIAELDLRARVIRVRFGRGHDVAVVSPFGADDGEWALDAACRLAGSRLLRVASVGDGDWHELADRVAAAHEHVQIERLSPTAGIPLAAFDAGRFDVVAASQPWAASIGEIVAATASPRVAAHALLAERGPSLFMPAPDDGFGLAGHGVVNPSGTLLAAALVLEYGLGLTAAAETLSGSISVALLDGPRTPDLLRSGVGVTSREFTSRVLAGFQLSCRNAEFWQGAA
jgi:3-isopropylmalate dehydrogenase